VKNVPNNKMLFSRKSHSLLTRITPETMSFREKGWRRIPVCSQSWTSIQNAPETHTEKTSDRTFHPLHKHTSIRFRANLRLSSSPDGFTPFRLLKGISFALGLMGNFKYLKRNEYMSSLEKICFMRYKMTIKAA